MLLLLTLLGPYQQSVEFFPFHSPGKQGILSVMGGKGATYKYCKRMAINALVEHMCEEEGVGFIDLWGYFVGKEDMYMRDGLHLSGKGAAVFSEYLLRSMDCGTGCNYLN